MPKNKYVKNKIAITGTNLDQNWFFVKTFSTTNFSKENNKSEKLSTVIFNMIPKVEKSIEK